MKNNVSGTIFAYQQLIEKAEREVARLDKAESEFDVHVLDHALNAAFSVFHLLEWRQKNDNPAVERKAFKLLEDAKNPSLNLLHDIVTFNKHAKVGESQHQAPLNVRTSADINYFALEDGSGLLLTEAGDKLLLEDSRLVVKFDDQKALDVLRKALKEFKGD